MKNNTQNIDEEYYNIFGKKERPLLYDPDDEGYNSLRQLIVSTPREEHKEGLPFKNLKVPSAEECRLDSSIQRIRRKKKRVFFMKSGRSPRLKTNAAAYYDYSTDRFIVLEGSYCMLTPYTQKLLDDYEKRYRMKANPSPFNENFLCKNGYVYLLKDLTYISADIAASFWTGRKTTFLEWKDIRKTTLDKHYNRFRTIASQ